MTAYEQRSYPGAAADTLLNADLTNVGASFSVTPGSGTGYPDGSQGPFFVIIDWDNSKAEKVRCSGRVNDTFTVAGTGGGRGQDGTSAQAHTANAKVRAVITATDIQEANRAAAQTIGKVTTKGDLLAGTGANALTRVPVGADGTAFVADSTQAAGVAWKLARLVATDSAHVSSPIAASGNASFTVTTGISLATFDPGILLRSRFTGRSAGGDGWAAVEVLTYLEREAGSATGIVTLASNGGVNNNLGNNTGTYLWGIGAGSWRVSVTAAADASTVTFTVTNNGATSLAYRATHELW